MLHAYNAKQDMKRFRCKVYLAVIALGCLDSCSQKQVPMFDWNEYARFARQGDGHIQGFVCVRTEHGGMVLGSDMYVYLNPVTTLSKDWFERVVRPNSWAKSGGPDSNSGVSPGGHSAEFLKVVTSDKNGWFEFRNLPPGEYLITCPMEWNCRARWYQFGIDFVPRVQCIAYAKAKASNVIKAKVGVTRQEEFRRPLQFERVCFISQEFPIEFDSDSSE